MKISLCLFVPFLFDIFILFFILLSVDEHFATGDDLRSSHQHSCPGHQWPQQFKFSTPKLSQSQESLYTQYKALSRCLSFIIVKNSHLHSVCALGDAFDTFEFFAVKCKFMPAIRQRKIFAFFSNWLHDKHQLEPSTLLVCVGWWGGWVFGWVDISEIRPT